MASHSHLNSMDVRVLICWHPGNTFQATVMSFDVIRGWSKVYPSKQDCMDDLWHIGLLTLVEHFDGLRSSFDIEDRMLIARAITEQSVLKEAGFVEIIPAKAN